MTTRRLAVALAVTNLVLLLLLTAERAESRTAQDVAPVVRGRAFELVDAGGVVRSRLNVESGGEVVLRMMDRKGTIRVKLGAGEDGSGLVLLDEATEPAIHFIARRTGTSTRPNTTSITLKGKDDQQRVIRP